MSELEQIKEDIKETKAKLKKAEDANMPVDYLNNLIGLLAEQQKKENLLLAQSVPAAPGKSPSNRFFPV